jgi:hypothetical protein
VCNQTFYDFAELYVRDGLHGSELGAFKEHLLRCEECRESVAIDILFKKRQTQSDLAPSTVPVDFEGVSMLVQLAAGLY